MPNARSTAFQGHFFDPMTLDEGAIVKHRSVFHKSTVLGLGCKVSATTFRAGCFADEYCLFTDGCVFRGKAIFAKHCHFVSGAHFQSTPTFGLNTHFGECIKFDEGFIYADILMSSLVSLGSIDGLRDITVFKAADGTKHAEFSSTFLPEEKFLKTKLTDRQRAIVSAVFSVI